MRKKCEVDKKILSYIENGTGTPIVFLHGWGRSAADFESLIGSFGTGYRLIAIDLPGHGDSQEPEGDLSLDGLCDTLTKFLKEIDVENPILVCHSFGARLAIKLAAKGENDNKLIFTGGAGIEIKSLSFKMKVFHYKWMKLLVNTPLYKQYKQDLLASSGSADYKNASPVMKRVMSLATSEDLSKSLYKINNQTLLYWGEKDEATPLWQGEMMAERIANSTLITKPNLSHYAFLEDSVDFNKTALQFIGGDL